MRRMLGILILLVCGLASPAFAQRYTLLPQFVSGEGWICEIFFTNQDRPGVIGKVGTILGENRINSAGFYLGRESYEGSAVGFVALDSRVPEGVLKELTESDEIMEAKEIVL